MTIINIDDLTKQFNLQIISFQDLNNYPSKVKNDLLKAFTLLEILSFQPFIFKTLDEDIFFIIFLGTKAGVVNYTHIEALSDKAEKLGNKIAKYIDKLRGIED